jgi:hypothetical protein
VSAPRALCCHRPEAARAVSGGRDCRLGLRIELAVDELTLLGEYDTSRVGMLMNHRPDGSLMNA